MLLDARKVGRPPSDNPKATKLTVRIDAEETKILDNYCEQKKVKRADGVREGIRRLKK